MSRRGTLVKSKSESDLLLVETSTAMSPTPTCSGDTEALTYNFENEDDPINEKPPNSVWKAKLIRFIDDVEDVYNRYHSTSPHSNELKRNLINICLRRNTPQLLFYFILIILILLVTLISLHKHYHHSYQYSNAYEQSFGLFQHISNKHWTKLKDYHHSSNPHKFGDVDTFIDDPNVWYQYNWNKNFVCPQEERIGISPASGGSELGDGPKWVCNSRDIVRVVNERMKLNSLTWAKEKLVEVKSKRNDHQQKNNGCLIYSIGVNAQHLGFEMGIQQVLTQEAEKSIEQYEQGKPFCEIHVFDPDDYDNKLVIAEGIQYHNWGIRSSKEEALSDIDNQGNTQFKTFQQTVKELNHEGRIIDIMKVDCKMCEWSIFEDWFDNGEGGENKNESSDDEQPYTGLSMIQQLLVEVHGTPEQKVNAFFEKLVEENYVIFHRDANTETQAGMSQDYAFLKLAPTFFE